MQYGTGWNGRDGDRERAWCAAVTAVCMVAVLVLVLAWIAGIGLSGLWRAARPDAAGKYPDPACEVCGMVLDGRHPACAPEGSVKSAAVLMARDTGEP